MNIYSSTTLHLALHLLFLLLSPLPPSLPLSSLLTPSPSPLVSHHLPPSHSRPSLPLPLPHTHLWFLVISHHLALLLLQLLQSGDQVWVPRNTPKHLALVRCTTNKQNKQHNTAKKGLMTRLCGLWHKYYSCLVSFILLVLKGHLALLSLVNYSKQGNYYALSIAFIVVCDSPSLPRNAPIYYCLNFFFVTLSH